ncbi:uncharacterized protein METZ01_LOCUS325818 [marine metagenome]|uniref:Uncharacterized protein n=1 Tax=marine metagenome TaxID=408172 RepID=A0A382PHU0_9ZZZZ
MSKLLNDLVVELELPITLDEAANAPDIFITRNVFVPVVHVTTSPLAVAAPKLAP